MAEWQEVSANLDEGGRAAARPWVRDQADGLRRMFGHRAPKVVAFASGREACGRTTLIVQTASALAAAGYGVLIVDENQTPNNVISSYGFKPRHDFYQVLQGQCLLEESLLVVAPHIRILPASLAAQELGYAQRDAAAACQKLPQVLQALQRGVDFILIDAAVQYSTHLSMLALASRHMAVIVGAESSAITRAYALIKRLAQERGRDGFQMVITRPRSPEDARAIFDNMRRVAKEHLDVRLEYLGAAVDVTTDHLADALLKQIPSSTGFAHEDGFMGLQGAQLPSDDTSRSASASVSMPVPAAMLRDSMV